MSQENIFNRVIDNYTLQGFPTEAHQTKIELGFQNHPLEMEKLTH
jgi:hypothetical protein